MIDITFSFNGFSLSEYLSKYRVTHEVETATSLTAMDGTEYVAARRRPVIRFTLIPLTDQQATQIYNLLLSLTGTVSYTDPNIGERQDTMRIASDLDLAFGIKSITGDRYYKCGEIVLRSIRPL
jgi:hypothetical protein